MAQDIKNLTDSDIEAVCKIIDGWTRGEKLTWNALVEDIEKQLYRSWSRQALDRHTRIKQAYALKKKYIQKSPAKSDEHLPPDIRKAKEVISRLESENERLTLENKRFLEQFIRWSHNAETKGVSEDILNRPLNKNDRGSSRDER